MKEVYDFIKKAGVYYLATDDNGKPRVRPFGTINIFEDKLYVQTGKIKDCYKQMANKQVELCAFQDGAWLRLTGTLIPDERISAQEDMLNHYEELKGMYKAGDGNTIVLYFKDATATFYGFGQEPRVIKF